MPVAVQVGGQAHTVRQVRVHQTDTVMALLDRISPSLEMPLRAGLLGARRPELIDFLAAATGIARATLAECPGDDLLSLLALVCELNPPLFPQPHAAPSTDASQQGNTWASIFAELVRRGHRAADIPHLGLAQLVAYLGTADGAPTITTGKPCLSIVK